jgi:hypothetical protein
MVSSFRKIITRQAKSLIDVVNGKVLVGPLSSRYILNSGNIDFLVNRFYPLFLKSQSVNGCVVEFGVGAGRTALMLESLINLTGDKRSLYLFDSFKGFPVPSSQDLTGTAFVSKGEYNLINKRDLIQLLSASTSLSPSEYWRNNSSRINIIEVYFETSFTDSIVQEITRQGGISFLHLDVDLYQSYLFCLHKCWDLVNSGGVILFDEYHESSLNKFPGAKKAIDEFLHSKGLNPSHTLQYDDAKHIVKRVYLVK